MVQSCLKFDFYVSKYSKQYSAQGYEINYNIHRSPKDCITNLSDEHNN